MAWNIEKLNQSEFTEGCSTAAYYRNVMWNKLIFREDVYLSKRGECDYVTYHLTQVASYLNKSIGGGDRMANSSHPTLSSSGNAEV
jgi:hypothetical protein